MTTSVELLTGKTADVHLLQVLSFKDDDGQFAGCRYIAQREADVTQLVLLHHNVHPLQQSLRHYCTHSILVPLISTRSSAIAEGLREALVSRNPATTKHLT